MSKNAERAIFFAKLGFRLAHGTLTHLKQFKRHPDVFLGTTRVQPGPISNRYKPWKFFRREKVATCAIFFAKLGFRLAHGSLSHLKKFKRHPEPILGTTRVQQGPICNRYMPRKFFRWAKVAGCAIFFAKVGFRLAHGTLTHLKQFKRHPDVFLGTTRVQPGPISNRYKPWKFFRCAKVAACAIFFAKLRSRLAHGFLTHLK